MKTNNKGFSLVELIVVIAVMAILAAVAIPTFAGFITKANKASDDQWANDMAYAIKISTTLDPATDITVTAAKDGNATVTFTVGSVNYSLTKAAPTTAPENGDLDLMKEIHGTMDWTYTFKSDKYASGVELN